MSISERLQKADSVIDMCKVSIIVPVYNAQSTLEKCIASITAQTYRDFELLLINDGSVDNSADICRAASFEDARIVYIEKENGGAASVRNLGIDSAKGDYLCFIDSDDYVEPDMLEFMYDKAIQHNADIVQCGYIMENDGVSSAIVNADGVYCGDEINNRIVEIKSKNLIDSPCNKLYKRSFVVESGVRMPENEAFEDTDFNLRLLRYKPKIVLSERAFYHYILHMGSTTRHYNPDKLNIMKKRAKLLKEVTRGIDDYCDFYLIKSVFSAIIDMFLSCSKKQIYTQIKNECISDEFYAAAKNSSAVGIGAKIIRFAARSRNSVIIYLSCYAFYILKYKLQKLFLKVR